MLPTLFSKGSRSRPSSPTQPPVLGGTYTPSFRAWFLQTRSCGDLSLDQTESQATPSGWSGEAASSPQLKRTVHLRLPPPSPASWSFTPPSLRSPGKRETAIRVPSSTLKIPNGISLNYKLSWTSWQKTRHSCTLPSPIFTWEGRSSGCRSGILIARILCRHTPCVPGRP